MIPEIMKAVLLTGHGGLDMLVYTEVPTPAPERGEVLVKVGVCGLDNTDISKPTAWYSRAVTGVIGDGATGGFGEAEGDFDSLGAPLAQYGE